MKKKTQNTMSLQDTLSSLDWAIYQSIEAPRASDEFTAKDFAEKSGLGVRQALIILDAMKGIKKRKATIEGRRANLYRRA